MKQTVLSRNDLYKRAVWHDALDLAFVFLANLNGWWECNGLDLGKGGIDGRLVRSGNFDDALSVDVLNTDGRLGFGLDFLNDFTARANDGSDGFTWNRQ